MGPQWTEYSSSEKEHRRPWSILAGPQHPSPPPGKGKLKLLESSLLPVTRAAIRKPKWEYMLTRMTGKGTPHLLLVRMQMGTDLQESVCRSLQRTETRTTRRSASRHSQGLSINEPQRRSRFSSTAVPLTHHDELQNQPHTHRRMKGWTKRDNIVSHKKNEITSTRKWTKRHHHVNQN